jgi:nucleotide-binding universal stress UspA family protein
LLGDTLPGGTFGRWPFEESDQPGAEVSRAEVEARSFLESAAAQVTAKVSLSLLFGDAAVAVAERVVDGDIDLVVMTTHARVGLSRALLGSVASTVIRESRVPVLAIRPELTAPDSWARRVLVPLDGSELAAAIIPRVKTIAGKLGWTLVLASVLPGPAPAVPVQGAWIPLGIPGSADPEDIAEYLNRTAGQVRADGLAAEIVVTQGDRVESLANCATDNECGLIAMATHGRSGLRAVALGSLTDALIRSAPVPVLAVRPDV